MKLSHIIYLLTAFLTSISSVYSAATGFFHVEETEGEWKLMDPDGKPFYMRGMNHCGDGTWTPWNLKETYGTKEKWRASMPSKLKSWGFNHVATSIGPSAVDPALGKKMGSGKPMVVTRTPEWKPEWYTELKTPFTYFMDYPLQYMAGQRLPDVFSEEFQKGVDERCREVCIPLRDNPELIGYYYTQNPPWHPQTVSFPYWIENCNKPGSAGRIEYTKLMRRIYGTIERWRETYGYPLKSWEELHTFDQALTGYISTGRKLQDDLAFMHRICQKWYKTWHDTIRKYDSNHLILGDRNTLHLQPLPSYAIEVMRPYIDVLSVNVMGPPKIVYGVLEQATRTWDGAIILADTGADIFEGEKTSGFPARDLDEFESVYAGMMKMGIQHPQIIGFAWCGYFHSYDPCPRGGVVDCRTDEPIPERLHIMKIWNKWMEENYK